MTPEQAQDAAWAEMEADAAIVALRSAAERALRGLEWVGRAGGNVESARRNAIMLLREVEDRARAISGGAGGLA